MAISIINVIRKITFLGLNKMDYLIENKFLDKDLEEKNEQLIMKPKQSFKLKYIFYLDINRKIKNADRF